MQRNGKTPGDGGPARNARRSSPSTPGRPAGSTDRNGTAGRAGFVERATASNHSGHGSESVRPHLRDQLRLKSLLPSPFPVPDTQRRAKDS